MHTGLIFPLSFLLALMIGDSISEESGERNRARWAAVIAGWFLYVIIILASWSTNIYPHINPSYGGGLPITVQFVVENDRKIDLFKQLGINFVSQNKTEPLQLVDDSGSTFTVLLANGQAAKIDQGLVANILYWTQKQLRDSNQLTQTTCPNTSVSQPTLAPSSKP